jgi:hypothetical protein
VADQITQDDQGRTYKNGVLQTSSSPSPGVGGAIQSMIAALAQAFAPKGLTQRGQRVNQAVDEASGAPQSSDLGSQF